MSFLGQVSLAAALLLLIGIAGLLVRWKDEWEKSKVFEKKSEHLYSQVCEGEGAE